jgi:hypothetical protein
MAQAICTITGQPFQIAPQELALLDTLQSAHPLLTDTLPLPTVAPMEFLRRFAAWGNLLNLFKSHSALSGRSLLSRYNPALPYKVCAPEEFWSQQVDNSMFARPYDFSRPFFDQYDELLRSVYWVALSNPNCEGSEYVNGANGAKNSYLSFGVFNSEECLYCYMVSDSQACIDCVDCTRCQYCFDARSIHRCYECFSCSYSRDCTSCIFCDDCVGCSNCLFCYGLRHAQYMIENQPVTREYYESYLQSLHLESRMRYLEAQRHFSALLVQSNHIAQHSFMCEESIGFCLSQVQNVRNSFYTHNAQDCGYVMLSHDCKDVWRGIGERAELAYQSSLYFGGYAAYNCYTDVGGNFNLYSTFLYNGCSHCFGCAGLNKKSYAILNKQYSKEEYYALVPQIVAHMKSTGEWGAFFPPRIAPHYVEHSFANDWMVPCAPDELRQLGYRVMPEDAGSNLVVHESAENLAAKFVPDTFAEFQEAPTAGVFECAATHKRFKLQRYEVDFYTRYNLPPPAMHWQERMLLKTRGTIRD